MDDATQRLVAARWREYGLDGITGTFDDWSGQGRR
jgi:hypothetical protein